MVEVFALGSNSGGQLGTGDKEDAHKPTPCKFSQEAWVYNIVGGGNHAFAWPQDGSQLCAVGSNKDGQLGFGYSREVNMVIAEGKKVDFELKWKPVKMPEEGRIKQIACGWSHSLALMEDGKVFATGSNDYRQISDGSTNGFLEWMPCPSVRNIPKVTAIACGMRHSVAVSEDSSLVLWGANRHGQLGHESKSKKDPDPCPVHFSKMLPPIAMVAGGRNHTVVIAEDRKTVFVAGQDKFGQCGPSSSETVMPTSTWRSFVLPRPAKKLCSGWDSCAVLLEPDKNAPNNVVMWGRADHGQLGRKMDVQFSRELVEVPLANVDDLACGSNHAIAKTSDGSVYLWGWNEHGNAGDPSLQDVYEPLKLTDWPPHMGSIAVVSIGCGYGNSYVGLEKALNDSPADSVIRPVVKKRLI
ncbi:alpha tubulin suppressor [Coemansia sp. RSA 2610]|nr:alpha tubulin suppressor [Coemansia sp. RSA 2610]